MIEKIQERSPISCKLVRKSAAALDPVKMALLESESEQSLFNKIVDIMLIRNVLLQIREILLRNSLMTFFKRFLNVTRLNLPILIKRLCVLMSFLVFT